MKIKQILLASAASLLPLTANAAPPVPFTWSGFYVGAAVGGGTQGSSAVCLNECIPTDPSISGSGIVFGIFGGYNYQIGSIVLGLETDIAASNITGITSLGGGWAAQSTLTSLGTVRGRIGYAFDRVLVYGTGGFAYGNVNNVAGCCLYPPSYSATSGTQVGWTAGGGVEYAISNNWIVRGEGLYVDLGSATGNINTCGCRFGFKNTYAIGRLGLEYKF